MKITVKPGLEIGDGCPPFIIAEVGSNWRVLHECQDAIHQAKQAGADAVKFQLFNAESLYGGNPGGYLSFLSDIDKHALPAHWLPKLKEQADKCGIEFMCTAFSPELYTVVDAFVDIHKVASAECTHLRILEMLRIMGKPVILSTGAHGFEDIKAAHHVLTAPFGTIKPVGLVLLYCVAAYPASEVDLYQIPGLMGAFQTLAGYSDHTTDILCIPYLATQRGACVIEKHFTALPDVDTPDRHHSLDPDQFKRMVESIRGTQQMSFGPSRAERGMLLRHNRRLIAIRDIAVGDALKEGENFGIYRSLKDETHAWGPFMVNELAGRAAKKEIKAGDGIGPGDV